MAKTVWIINQYASTPETGMGGRHYLLAKELAANGVNVYLIMASFHHLLRSPTQPESTYQVSTEGNFHVVRVKVPVYDGAHNGRRILNWAIFAYRLLGLKRVIDQEPDAVLYSSLSLVGVLSAERLARHYKVPLTFEVRDLWPLTLTEIGGVSRRHPFVRFLQWVEDRAYRVSDRVVSNLPGAVDHMVGRGLAREKFVWIPNGISIKAMESGESLNTEVAGAIPGDQFVVGYAGTIGVANALDCFLSAAALLKNETGICFVLVGNGKEKDRLRGRVEQECLPNVRFLPAIAKAQVPSLLKKFDACFIGWKDESLYRFGIGANKIPEYFFSGKPVIHAFSGGYDPVAEFGAGITVPAESPEPLAKAILGLYRMTPEERDASGENGRRAALENYDYAQLAKRLENVLFEA
ncbi:MAG: glycosyltransferase family 4 protein [Pseudomonadota bacterium]